MWLLNIFKWVGHNWLKLTLLGLGTIITFSIFHYLVILPNERDAYKKSQELGKESDEAFTRGIRERDRESCLTLANLKFQSDFTINSNPVRGEEGVREWRTNNIRDNVTQDFHNAQDLCFKKFPIDK